MISNMKDKKNLIKQINETQIKPLTHGDGFLRWNLQSYAYSEFGNEAQRLQPNNTGITDFTNIRNMANAWDYVLQRLKTKHPITMADVCHINSIIAQNNNCGISGGTFRYCMAYNLGAPAPDPTKVIDLLNTAIYKMNTDKNNILTKAFDIHYNIIAIQPFCDFNKRTGRIVMNWYLLQNNYTPILFNKKHDTQQYVDMLRARLQGDNKAYTTYMCDSMLKTQHDIIKALNKRTK